MEKTKIVIFDDNKNLRKSIGLLLNTELAFDVVGIFSDARQCVKNVLELKPDVVLMDVEMPGVNGIEAVRLLKKEIPGLRILIQTVFEDDEIKQESYRAGASGYILKNNINSGLIMAIKALYGNIL